MYRAGGYVGGLQVDDTCGDHVFFLSSYLFLNDQPDAILEASVLQVSENPAEKAAPAAAIAARTCTSNISCTHASELGLTLNMGC